MTRCPDAIAPVRELAGLRVRQGRWTEASQLARRALARDPADEHARRVLATSLFLQDDPSGALRVWNQLGEPVIDLIQVQGLSRTRHAVLERVLGLTPNTVLTTARLKQARRRLTLLPTPTSPRVGYRPRAGRAEVEVAVDERPVVALDTGHWVRAGMRAATDRTVRLDIASPTGNGQRWSASWRWWSPRPRLALFLDTPAPRPKLGSVWQIGLSWEQQTYGGAVPVAGRTTQDGSLVTETQQRASLTVKDWAPTDVYWEATAEFDEWSAQGKYASLGFRVATHRFEEHFATGAEAHGWTGLDGGTPFATWALFSTWRSSTARTGLRWTVRGGVDIVTADAPRALWPGAGVGHARRALLRAHPLLDDGVIATDGLSRRLTSLTLEVEHAWRPRWPLQVSVVGFVDGARGWGHVTPERSSRTHMDVGAGVRLGVPGQASRLRIDLARGLQDGALAASLGWELPWPH